jgi:autotransporter family porin
MKRLLALLALAFGLFGLWRFEAAPEPAPAATALPSASSLVTRSKAPISDRAAAKLVKRSSSEPRRGNRAATHRTPDPVQVKAFRAQSEMPYAGHVTGNFTGTTDEVIQWAAAKWGFSADLLRAVAVVETWWKMETVGDSGDSFGLYQVRRPYHCKEPVCEEFRTSAAFNADYYGAILRAYHDGKQDWLNDVAAENGKPYRRGDVWGSVGAWYSGRWWSDLARGYIDRVQDALSNRTWSTREFIRG